jgi:hypothetical protein
MTYTIEYLENGARKWKTHVLSMADSASSAREMFFLWIRDNRSKWEAARLIETNEMGVEWLLQAWDYAVAESYLPTLLAARPQRSDLGDSLRAQLLEIEEDVDRLSKKVAKVLSDYK